MDEDEMQDAIEPGDPLQRQLARYARVRLEPDPAAIRRIRSAVMSETWRRHLAAQPVEIPPRRSAPRMPFAGWSIRRLGSTLTAAVLTGLLVAGTVFAGSRAGGPLYEARLSLETVLLPADPEARVEAELAMAQTRLAEASQAAVAGDRPAFEAALAGYARVVDDLADAVGGPGDRALAAVQLHLEILRALRERLPAAAWPGLDLALERSSGAVERLERAGAGGGTPGGGTPGGGTPGGGTPGGGTPGGGKPGGGTPGAGPGAPTDAPTTKPEKTPKPVRTATPTAAPTDSPPAMTPKPGNTPKPAKTPAPAPDQGEDGSAED